MQDDHNDPSRAATRATRLGVDDAVIVSSLCSEVNRLRRGLEGAGRALDELGSIVDVHRGDEDWHGELQRKIEEAWYAVDCLVTR